MFTAALFTTARKCKQPRCPSTDEWIKKLWYIYTMEYYSAFLRSFFHKKECIWIHSNEVDEPRPYYTEWSKSEREKQIPYINAYMRNLERWYWWTCLQGSSGDTDTENRPVDPGGEEWVGKRESSIETYVTVICILGIQWGLLYDSEDRTDAMWQCREVEWGERWEGDSRGRGYVYIHTHLWLIHVDVRQETYTML